jgi:hypothetical protein
MNRVLAKRANENISRLSPVFWPRRNEDFQKERVVRKILDRLQGTVSLCASLMLFFAGSCAESTSQRTCTKNSDCAANQECRLDICRPQTSAPSDAGNTADAGRLACAAGGNCVLGERCLGNADCKSQFCAAGVCCNEPCGGGCESCGLATSLGSCRKLPKGTACGAFACNGTSSECPSQCTKPSECAYAYTCCTLGKDETSTECVAQGQSNKCIQLPACSSIQDSFQAATLDTSLWSTFSTVPGAVSSTANGRLRIALDYPATATAPYSGVSLKRRVSLVGSSCQIEVVDLSPLEDLSAFALAGLVLSTPTDEGSFDLRVSDSSTLVAGEALVGQSSPTVESAVLGPSARRFLRIAEDGGLVSFQYSRNGVDFTQLGAVKPTLRPSDVTVSVSVYEEPGKRDGGISVVFDNFNGP